MNPDTMIKQPRGARAARFFTLVGLVLFGCGGGEESGGAANAGEAPAGEPVPVLSSEVARADFVLCAAIEEIADALATIGGFERDRDRAIQTFFDECHVRGDGGPFVSVQWAPAITSSIEMHASGYEAEKRPAPDFGPQAVFVADQFQPHLIFEVLGQIIDVGMENFGTPTEAAVGEAAAQVREALLAANAG